MSAKNLTNLYNVENSRSEGEKITEKTNEKNNPDTKKNSNNDNQAKSFKEELIYFKNDILKDLKGIENKINEKIEQQKNKLEAKVGNLEQSMSSTFKKFSFLSDPKSIENLINEKITNLESFKKRADASLSSLD